MVAVTGTRPSSLNDPVAGGSESVPVRVDVVRSAVVVSVPGPRSMVESIALMNVLPVTGYETLTVESDGARRRAGQRGRGEGDPGDRVAAGWGTALRVFA